MPLPQAVQAQVDEVNRIQAAMAQPESETSEVDTPEVQEPVQQELPLDEPQQPQATTDWEHKYRSEIGRFKAETDRAREAAQAAWQQIEALKQEIAQLKVAPEKAPEPEIPGVTDSDVEAFGSDLVEFAQRAARKAAADQLKVLDAKLAGVFQAIEEMRGQVGTVESTARQSAEEVFFNKLAQAVPDWEQINAAQPWFDWLQEADPFTGIQRQVLLNDARAKLDVGRVANIFNAFKTTQQPSAAPAQAQTSKQQELQKQVSPPKSRTGSAAAPAKGSDKIWTEKEVSAFYLDKAMKRIDPATAERMEAEINQAAAEGRVR